MDEVTIRPYIIDCDDFLDGLLASEPHVVNRIMDAAKAGDVSYHRCAGAREAHIIWLASAPPPLPIIGIANHDPRTCAGTWTRVAERMTSEVAAAK